MFYHQGLYENFRHSSESSCNSGPKGKKCGTAAEEMKTRDFHMNCHCFECEIFLYYPRFKRRDDLLKQESFGGLWLCALLAKFWRRSEDPRRRAKDLLKQGNYWKSDYATSWSKNPAGCKKVMTWKKIDHGNKFVAYVAMTVRKRLWPHDHLSKLSLLVACPTRFFRSPDNVLTWYWSGPAVAHKHQGVTF